MTEDDHRLQAALNRCDQQIGWYTRYARREWILFVVFQTSAVALAAATPVLILWSSLPEPLQALPAALASVAAGLVGTFHWLQNKTRFAYTAEALKSERVLFETRTPPRYGRDLTDDEALAGFITRVEEISMGEVSEWRTDVTRPTTAG